MFKKIFAVVDGLDMSSKVLDAVIYLVKEQQVEFIIFYVGCEVVVFILVLIGIVYVLENFIEDIKYEVE